MNDTKVIQNAENNQRSFELMTIMTRRERDEPGAVVVVSFVPVRMPALFFTLAQSAISIAKAMRINTAERADTMLAMNLCFERDDRARPNTTASTMVPIQHEHREEGRDLNDRNGQWSIRLDKQNHSQTGWIANPRVQEEVMIAM